MTPPWYIMVVLVSGAIVDIVLAVLFVLTVIVLGWEFIDALRTTFRIRKAEAEVNIKHNNFWKTLRFAIGGSSDKFEVFNNQTHEMRTVYGPRHVPDKDED